MLLYAIEFALLPMALNLASFYLTDMVKNRLVARASYLLLFLLILGFCFTTPPGMLE
jgi:hypothetical protein